MLSALFRRSFHDHQSAVQSKFPRPGFVKPPSQQSTVVIRNCERLRPRRTSLDTSRLPFARPPSPSSCKAHHSPTARQSCFPRSLAPVHRLPYHRAERPILFQHPVESLSGNDVQLVWLRSEPLGYRGKPPSPGSLQTEEAGWRRLAPTPKSPAMQPNLPGPSPLQNRPDRKV